MVFQRPWMAQVSILVGLLNALGEQDRLPPTYSMEEKHGAYVY